MRRVSFSTLVGTAVAGVALAALSGNLAAGADEPVTKQLYGSGVHAYFAKEYKEAYDLLSTAIGNKSQDPRVYYFRGLAQWQLGRPDEAKADFKAGADLEATAGDDLFNIDKALERIQGKARLQIQDARQVARANAVQRRLTEEERRYNRIRDNEPFILQGVAPPAKAPAKKGEPVAPEAAPKKADPPKANPASEPAKNEPAKNEPAKNEPAAAEPTSEFAPLRKARLPVTPRKAAAAEPKLAAEPKPAADPEPKVAEPKVAEPKLAAAKPKDDPAPRPASPSGKKATTALARIVGKLAHQYAEETAKSFQEFPPSGGLVPPAKE